MEKIKYAIFDVGQTIYHFSFKPLNTLLQKESASPEMFSTDNPLVGYNYDPYMKGEIDNIRFVKDLCELSNVPYSKGIAIKINKALHLGCDKPFDETIEAMQQLRGAGVELAILSNALPLLHDTKTDLVKPDFSFTSYNLGLLKPDVEIYKAVAQKLQTPYEQLLFIDDKRENVSAAQTLGIKGIVYQRETILAEIKKYLPYSSTHQFKQPVGFLKDK